MPFHVQLPKDSLPVPGAQMIVADLTESANRANALAKIGLCFGIGMITGSTLGGTLTTRYG